MQKLENQRICRARRIFFLKKSGRFNCSGQTREGTYEHQKSVVGNPGQQSSNFLHSFVNVMSLLNKCN